MNAVIPIVVPMGGFRGGFSGGGEVSEFVENMPLFLGVPWGIFALLFIIVGGLVIVEFIDHEVAFKFIGWSFAILGTYTLIYCGFYLIRYLIGS